MDGKLKIYLGSALIASSFFICCLLIALSTPWYAEGVDVTGENGSLQVQINTHAFYWNYYCDGGACDIIKIKGKDANGIYSWYDACQDCDSQLTLYVFMWILTLCVTIGISISWLLTCSIIWALSKGYPSKGVSVLLPIFWLIGTTILFIVVLTFPVSLPDNKESDNSCAMLTSFASNNLQSENSCSSFTGIYYFGIGKNSGEIYWGPSTGYIFLIVAFIFGIAVTLFNAYLCRVIRKQNDFDESVDYSAVPLENDFSMDQGFVTPGI